MECIIQSRSQGSQLGRRGTIQRWRCAAMAIYLLYLLNVKCGNFDENYLNSMRDRKIHESFSVMFHTSVLWS